MLEQLGLRFLQVVITCPLPSKDDTLSCTKSKVQLIQQISAGLVDIGLTEKNRLVIKANDHCPSELKDGKKTLRSD